jgi:hypothetical protein
MVFEYKCVLGPMIVAVRNSKARDQAAKAFEDIMNGEAADGWEYVGIDEFHTSEPVGMLSRKRVFVPSKILVFRREKRGSTLVEVLKAQSMPQEPDPSIKQEPPAESQGTPTLRAIAEKMAASKG